MTDPSGADQLPGGSVQHSQAVALVAVQLAAKFGADNIYADLDPHPATTCGAGKIDLGTPIGQPKAFPDLLKCGTQPYYVWEAKPANAKGVSEGPAQVAKYVSLLLDAGTLAQPGPPIVPETIYVPQLSGGYWLSVFNADEWSSYTDPGSQPPLNSMSSGLIFYASLQNLTPTPVPIPAFQLVKVARPGDLPGFASFTTCAQLNSRLSAAGLLGIGAGVAGALIDWGALGSGVATAGRWILGILEADVAEQL